MTVRVERPHGGQRSDMEIARSQIVEMLFERGELERAEQAEASLPERFDPLAQAEALEAIGLDAALLLTQADNLEA